MADVPRLHDKSFATIGLSVVILFVVGLVCSLLDAPEALTTSLSAGAAAVPAAIGYRMQAKRRAVSTEVDALEAGRVERPVGLVVTLLALAVLVLDTIAGVVIQLVGTAMIQSGLEALYYPVYLLLLLVTAGGVFGCAVAAGLRLGSHPYRWTLVALGAALIARLLIAFILFSSVLISAFGAGALGGLLVGIVAVWALYTGAAVAGTWVAVKRRPAFAAAKLERERAALGAELPAPAPDAPVATPASARPSPAAAAGWYPDPELRGVERWWDGSGWTDARRNTPAVGEPTA